MKNKKEVKNMAANDTCGDCKHNCGGYCDIYEKSVKSGSRACPEFEEN